MRRFIHKNKFILGIFQVSKCLVLNWYHKTTFPAFDKKEEDVLEILGRKKKAEVIPRILWMYWDSGTMPDYITKIISHTKNTVKDHDIIVLNSNTYTKYLDRIDFHDDMPLANKADLIRLELLYAYGGIWMDLTTILRDDIEWVHQISSSNYYDIIGYYRELGTIDERFPIVESWFLACCPKNELIRRWLEMFRQVAEIGASNYYAIISKRDDFDEIKQKLYDPKYLLIYLVCQIVCRENPDFNFYLKKAEDSAYYIQDFLENDNYKKNYVFCRLPSPLDFLPIIKLSSGDRVLIESFSKLGLIKNNSLIGKILNS